MSNTNNKRTLIDTLNFNGYTYDDYQDWCVEENIEAGDDNSMEYYEWLDDQTRQDYEDFIENIKYSKVCNTPCVVTGTIGRWNGDFEIIPKLFQNLHDAIKTCGENCNDIIVESENGVVYARCYHHDGHHSFEIRPLNDDGLDKFFLGEIYPGEELTETDFDKYPEYLF